MRVIKKAKSVEEIIVEPLNIGTDLIYCIAIPEKDLKYIKLFESRLNTDKREGFKITPVTDSYGDYICVHYPKRLVLCVVMEMWG